MVTSIGPSINPKSKSCILELTDGSYCLPDLVHLDKPSDGKEERFDCDRILMEQIQNGHIRPGDKFHFYGLFLFKTGLIGFDKWKEIQTKHYFLNNADKNHLKININGFAKAD